MWRSACCSDQQQCVFKGDEAANLLSKYLADVRVNILHIPMLVGMNICSLGG